MKVEFWSDIICPWCGLTEHRLGAALERFPHRDQVEVVHRSFPLHPDLPREGVTQRELSRRYGMTPASTEQALRPIEVLAEREGLKPYAALDRTLGPTDYLHELLAFATEKGMHATAWRAAFRAHFGEGRDLWTIDQVVSFAEEIGLDPVEAREAVESRRYRPWVERDQKEAQDVGARGTPFLVVDGRRTLSGARDTDGILALLHEAWASRTPSEVTDEAGGMCLPEDGVCLPDRRATS
ncbi:DsbA family oxidoreductase [Nocardioides sp. LHG3406-4]|uniref:DsbA family oxidoreductase n=1 Tax=Nocardioides sp. LHG3406-4 TaxID=2804575 RepID=UPI003CE8FF15